MGRAAELALDAVRDADRITRLRDRLEEAIRELLPDAAVNGDTVLVAPGTYNESIDFLGKAITVASSGGPEITRIYGNYFGYVYFGNEEGPDSIFDGFTVTGCGVYGGIYCEGASPIIRNNIIADNATLSGGLGGGIHCQNSSATIVNNIVEHNFVYEDLTVSGLGLDRG